MTLPVGSIQGILRLVGVAEFQQGVIGAQRSMNLAAGSANEMAAGVDRADAALAGSARSASAASVGNAKLRAAQLSATAATERYNAVLTDGNATLARRASAEASMIRANERVAASTRQVSTASTEANDALFATESRFRSLTKTAGGLGLAFGAFEIIKKAIDITKEAAAYQRSMTQIRTLTGASQQEVAALSKTLLDMAGKVAQSPEDLATSAYHAESALRKLGATAPQIYRTVETAAKGATIGNTDLEDTTNALTATMASGIVSYRQAGKAMGELLSIVGAGDMKVSDLNEALGTGLLVTMKTFGVDLTDTGAALAVFGDNNIRGADAATKLRMAVQDLAKPAANADSYLSQINLTAADLRDGLQKGGLNGALHLLQSRLDKAGITGKQMGGFLEDAFTKRAGTGLAILLTRMGQFDEARIQMQAGAGSFGARWSATTKTVAFQWSKLGAEAQAAGVKMASAALPIAGGIGSGLAVGLEGLLHVLQAIAPELKVVGAVWTGMWAGRAAVIGIQAAVDGVSRLRAALGNSLVDMQRYGIGFGAVQRGIASESNMVTAQLEADLASQEAAGMQAAAASDRAAAIEAQAFSDQTAASAAATDAQVADADARAAAAWAAARESAAAAAVSAGAAEDASAVIVASGESAEIGWAGLAGPLGAAALGIFAVVTMFHKSSTASKEAADAAKAYTDALSGDGGKTTIIDAITKQLKDNNLPELLDSLNKELGKNAFTGAQFATAIEKGGPPLDALRTRLQGIIDKGTILQRNNFGAVMGTSLTPAAQKATEALGHLNTQYSTLTKTAAKDLADTKSFAGVSASIDKTTTATKLGSDAAKQYAAMAGLVVDKNGIVAKSQGQVNAAVTAVARAYATASESGDQFLAALKTFSGTAGSAADRAALIGATLKAANGDALNFATQMNNAAVASHQFATDVEQAAKSVGKNGETTKAYLANLINLKTGTIDYHKAAAGPLLSDLNSIQSAAMQAAQATFQHAKATESAKQAADQAYKVYQSQTRGSLIDEAKQLGLTKDQAKKLADQYFGMPKQVKTMIEQEGANSVTNILNQIGKQLSYLTGHPWRPRITLDTSGVYRQLANLHAALQTATGNTAAALGHAAHNLGAGHNAAGTMDWRGGLTYLAENGPELVQLPRGSKVYPNNSPQTQAALHGNSGDQRPVEVTVYAPQSLDPMATAYAVGRQTVAALGLA